MREDLLGYLLSALEPHEMRKVEQQLLIDPLLQDEFEALQRELAPIDRAIGAEPVFETPPDLIARTLAALPEREPAHATSAPGHLGPSYSKAGSVSLATSSSGFTSGTGLTAATDGRSGARAGWTDFLVTALASAAVLGLLIPSISRGRYEARKTQCQEHLRQLGTAITQFVNLDSGQLLPQIAERGPFAFSGMYAAQLAERGLLEEGAIRWCPESEFLGVTNPAPFQVSESASSCEPIDSVVDKVIQVKDLREAHESGDVDRLRWQQQMAGGSYSYTLGVLDEGRYETPHYESRASFAVLGDSVTGGDEASAGVDASRLRWAHPGNGTNLLFEDGSVRFLNMSGGHQIPDHPYFNHRGSIEAGMNVDDASLAPSWRAPFLSSPQR
jgi:hypothetical protein